MSNNVYFALKTSTLGGKYFIAALTEKTTIRGSQRLQKVDLAVTGAVMLTKSPTTQKIHSFHVLINGSEQETFDPNGVMEYQFGDYQDLVDFFNESDVTFTDWNGTEYDCIFSGVELVPIQLSPAEYPIMIPISLMEKTSGAV